MSFSVQVLHIPNESFDAASPARHGGLRSIEHPPRTAWPPRNATAVLCKGSGVSVGGAKRQAPSPLTGSKPAEDCGVKLVLLSSEILLCPAQVQAPPPPRRHLREADQPA